MKSIKQTLVLKWIYILCLGHVYQVYSSLYDPINHDVDVGLILYWLITVAL